MREVPKLKLRVATHGLEADFPRLAAVGRIQKQNFGAACQRCGHLWSKLLRGHHEHFWGGQFLLEESGGFPSHAVIRAQRIAITNDQPGWRRLDQRRTSSITLPSGVISWISSAMRPSAWVEQLRQGS